MFILEKKSCSLKMFTGNKIIVHEVQTNAHILLKYIHVISKRNERVAQNVHISENYLQTLQNNSLPGFNKCSHIARIKSE
jgi:hypothetical protein